MLSKLTHRDRIALTAGAAAVALFVVVKLAVFPLLDRSQGGSVEEKELTLRRSQRLVASSGVELADLEEVQERVKTLEAGLLEGSSSSLASAEWQRLIRELADSKGIGLGSTELVRVQGAGPNYALVIGRVTLRCRLDQLVDFLAALATAPRILSVTRLRVTSVQGDTEKRMNIEMMIGAAMRAVPGTRSSAPEHR